MGGEYRVKPRARAGAAAVGKVRRHRPACAAGAGRAMPVAAGRCRAAYPTSSVGRRMRRRIVGMD
ncbi:hypothetical protein DF022_35730 [Burkholderia cepacia]|nr:hypothetical protein DF023_35680 [Burkholderia cepacia]RQT93485.1 hypothetical protein DF022_35730 [Burkholderia cepacia]RQZ70922.1 hypothetical protein DF056_36575 [Burkholderia cepacia]